MWWDRGKVPDLSWGRKRSSARPGPTGLGEGWNQGHVLCPGAALCTAGAVGKVWIVFVNVNHLVVGKSWVTPAPGQ